MPWDDLNPANSIVLGSEYYRIKKNFFIVHNVVAIK